MRLALLLPAVLMLVVFVRGAGADGGGRADAVAVGAGRIWTTVRDRVAAVDPLTGRRVGAITTGGLGGAISVAGGTLWRLQPHSLAGFDISTGHLRARVRLGRASYALAVTPRAVWVASFGADTVTRIDARSARRRGSVRVPHWPMAIAATRTQVWVASVGRSHTGRGGVMVPDGPGEVARLDPATGTVRAKIAVGRGPQAIALDRNTLWVLNGRGVGAEDTIDRVSIRAGRVVHSARVPHWPSALVVGRRYVWVVSSPRSAGGVVTRIDKRTYRARTRKIPNSWIPAGLALASGGVWIADPGVAALIRVDPHTLAITKRVTFPIG